MLHKENYYKLFRNQQETILPNIWDNVYINAFNLWYHNNKDKNIVICDVRFLNEAKMIKDNGGILIKIKRGNNETKDLYISEIEINQIQYDYLIDNDESIEELYKKIEEIELFK